MIVCGGPASHLSHFSSQDCGEETKVEIGIVIELEVEMELKLLLTAADLLTQGIEIHFIGTSIFPAFSFSLSLSFSFIPTTQIFIHIHHHHQSSLYHQSCTSQTPFPASSITPARKATYTEPIL